VTVEVDTGSRSYPVIIGAGCLNDSLLWQQLAQRQCAVVSNPVVAAHYLERVVAKLETSGRTVLTISLPDGESFKTWDSVSLIFNALLEAQFDRDAVLIALGGGVVGDLTGFAAATYQRGIDFVQVPTTLLAQVDSSVGGKTGFNLPAGKNMIGSFHQPIAVLADVSTLKTLSSRELKAGLAEVIKHAAIADRELFAYLEQHVAALLGGDNAALSLVVETSVRIKAGIVVEDERESGVRALLNFGHTFGHAIEAGLGFGTWLHGEAVAAGMVLAAELSVFSGELDQEQARRLVRLIKAFGLPTDAPAFDAGRWLELMSSDKKIRSGKRRLILLDRLGQARVVTIDDVTLRNFFAARAGILGS
jgi:3-dehydroquinate synthase